jgi:fructose-bisphosphate aldolase class 1
MGDKTFVEFVASKGMVPGIKVDKGTAALAGGLPE